MRASAWASKGVELAMSLPPPRIAADPTLSVSAKSGNCSEEPGDRRLLRAIYSDEAYPHTAIDPEGGAPMDKKQQVNVWCVLLAMLALVFFQSWWIERSQVETLPYRQFEKLLKEGGIEEMSVGTNVIEGKLKRPRRV